jgi:hypothetical protein
MCIVFAPHRRPSHDGSTIRAAVAGAPLRRRRGFRADAMRLMLCIVAADRPDIMEQARRAFADVDDVMIVMDRRIGERRDPARAQSEESRSGDRRTRNISERLRRNGYAIVPVGE